MRRLWLWGWLLALLAGCDGCGDDLKECDPACNSWQTCDLLSGTCRATPCETALDCGTPGLYACVEVEPGGAARGHDRGCRPVGCGGNEDCDDGLFCNGVERCDPALAGADSRGCAVAAAPACEDGERCDESTNLCRTVCAVPEDADGDGADAVACGGDDCDDNDAQRHPGAAEICDPDDRDEDCNPETVGFRDVDGDGFGDSACCNAVPGGGAPNCGRDCDDLRRSTHPTANEVCNERDDDCNGVVDDEVTVDGFPDADRDGYGAVGSTAVRVCPDVLGATYALDDNDCDDTNAAVTPGTFVCVGGQFPNQVRLCSSAGSWTTVACSASLVCVTQPNGLGVCE